MCYRVFINKIDERNIDGLGLTDWEIVENTNQLFHIFHWILKGKHSVKTYPFV